VGAHTILVDIGAVDTVSQVESGAVGMRLKWISSEKAGRQTQIQGCFWLVFPLLFWSGKKERGAATAGVVHSPASLFL